MEPVPRKRRLRLRYVAACFVLLFAGAAAVLFYLEDDPVTRMPPKSSIPADLPQDVRKKIEDLYSPDVWNRWRAATSLNGTPSAIPFLVPLLGDAEDLLPRQDPEFSWEYAKRFVRDLISHPEPEVSDMSLAGAATTSLVHCGLDALPSLDTVLRESRNSYARANAARALGLMNTPRALTALVPALSDLNRSVRLEAVQGFCGPAGPPIRRGAQRGVSAAAPGCRAAIPGLIALLKDDPSYIVRCYAAEALGHMTGCPEVVDPLIAALRDKDLSVARKAVMALGFLEDRRAVPELIVALGRQAWQVRADAAQSLAYIGDPAAAPHLVPLLKDRREEVRPYAAAALAWLVKSGLEEPWTVDEFVQAMKDNNPMVRTWAARGAGYSRDPRATMPLLALMADTDEDVCECAATALGTIGDERAVNPLIERLRNPSQPSRETVARALGVLGESRAVPPLLEALKDPDAAVRACAAEALGPFKASEAFEPLLALLDDPFPGVRAGAAQSLGSLGDRRAIPGLISLLQDERITMDTSQALRKLTGQDFGENPSAWQAWWEQNEGAEPGIDTISPR